MSNKYAIYVAEVTCPGTPVKNTSPTWDDTERLPAWEHCFLLLVDEKNGLGNNARIIQQLHFERNKMENVLPVLEDGIGRCTHLPTLSVSKQVGGDNIEILSQWNRILEYALQVKDASIPFGKGYKFNDYAINCRTGVKFALSAIGIDLSNDFLKSTAGTKATGMPIPTIQPINPDQDIITLQRQRQELSAQLPYVRINQAHSPEKAILSL